MFLETEVSRDDLFYCFVLFRLPPFVVFTKSYFITNTYSQGYRILPYGYEGRLQCSLETNR